jgi:hypothetical protein
LAIHPALIYRRPNTSSWRPRRGVFVSEKHHGLGEEVLLKEKIEDLSGAENWGEQWSG